jgi:archaeosine-15-forming tRNA-guanine transglycosylase
MQTEQAARAGSPSAETLRGNLLKGAKQIGDAINQTERQVYHMVKTGQLRSVIRKGRQLFALQSELVKEFTPGAAEK